MEGRLAVFVSARTLSRMANVLSLILFQHSETHFQKKLDSVSQPLPLNQHLKLALSQLIGACLCVCVCVGVCVCVRGCVCV